MRALVMGAVALLCVGCISVSPAGTASPAASQPATTLVVPTASPAPTPTAQPTAPRTVTRAPETPTAEVTPDPNITPDPNATAAPTPVDVLPFLSSEITILNLATQRLSVTVALVDAESSEEYVVGTFDVEPEQVTSQLVVPARLRLAFMLGGADLGTCTLDVVEGEELQFATVGTGVVFASNGPEPADAADMIVATAARCHAGAAT
jgi:hypothetical protein